MRYMKRFLEKIGIQPASLTDLDWAPDSKFLLLTLTVEEALNAWETLRANHEKSGYWPIIIGDAAEELEWLKPPDESRISVAAPEAQSLMSMVSITENLQEQLSALNTLTQRSLSSWEAQMTKPRETIVTMIASATTADPKVLATIYSETMAPAEAIAKGDGFDFAAWVAHRCAQSSLQEFLDAEPTFEHQPTESIGVLEAEPEQPCSLLLVKSLESWHTPAHLAFGAWNACPPSYVHVAALKRWNTAQRAELVSITRDSFYVRVNDPVESFDMALALAEEQYAYCPDLVQQSDGSLKGLAQEILDASLWSFWWA